MPRHPRALVAGASCAIGLLYADRLARGGYDLVMLGGATDRPQALARILRAETGVGVEVVAADIATSRGLDKMDACFADDAPFDLVVNNLGLPCGRTLADEDPIGLDRLIAGNVRAFARLTAAAARAMTSYGQGAIVNIASVVGIAPEVATGAHGASEAFAIALTRTLQQELASTGVHVQLVLTAATRTDIWPFTMRNAEVLPGEMNAHDLVDAALVGLGRGETVTIPSLENAKRRWASHERARTALIADMVNSAPARHYRDRPHFLKREGDSRFRRLQARRRLP